MKKADNFNASKWLVENKITTQSRLKETKNNYTTLDVKIGDKVKFYVEVPIQNIGKDGEKTIGTVIKINPTTFIVKDKKGREHKISKTWFKGATYLPSIIKEEKTWDDIDKELADEEAQDIKKAKTFVNTIQGKNAVRVIKALINKPYGYDKLDKVLQILNLDRQNFIYAAKVAGMDFETDAAGIHIYDDNYQDQDVAINQINGDWIVG
jgi:hypothetical protein